ncbi:MAG TPA: acyl-CoA dehydrogenase family protein [Anaerolineae bacterium]|nr:acyl-CoA dehydrogenase family protein [Anaerolineae bacterium]
MDFALTDDQKMFRDLFRDFATKEVAKVAKHIDEAEEPPIDLLKKAAAQGFLAATIPEELGGAALDPMSYALLIEETAKVCASTAITLALHNSLSVMPLILFGTADQKQRWAPKFVESIGAFALTEPDSGTDANHLSTRARKDGDHYIVNGVKTWVSNAGIASTLVFFAESDKQPVAFIVDVKTPGIKIGHREPTLGLRGVSINTVYFDQVIVPTADRLGTEGEGLHIAHLALAHMRLAIAALALGAAEGALALGRAFAIERRQFGVSIAAKQAIGNYFADTEIEIEALRHMVEYTAWLVDQKKDYVQAALKTKTLGGKVARDAANRMLQVHGGYGFSDEYVISRIYRDVRALDIMGGTPQIGRVLIARDMFAEAGVKIKP